MVQFKERWWRWPWELLNLSSCNPLLLVRKHFNDHQTYWFYPTLLNGNWLGVHLAKKGIQRNTNIPKLLHFQLKLHPSTSRDLYDNFPVVEMMSTRFRNYIICSACIALEYRIRRSSNTVLKDFNKIMLLLSFLPCIIIME